jgi:polysaccharide deacetylase family protein (PEP-CTERM system associated)
MINALTIDVEDYHNVFARDRLRREGPPTEAVVRNTQRLLAILASRGVRATFFVLGEVVEVFPDLVRQIAAGGHELAVHGFRHDQVFKLRPPAFREDTRRAKRAIEQIIGSSVEGYRAPAFSIVPDTSWAFEILAELGFRYDASVFPIAGRRYGWPGFPPDIHEMPLLSGRRIIEAPASTVSIFGKRLPACGGGYIRHFPGAVTRWAMRRIQRRRPAIVYMHPYEIELAPAAPDTSGLEPPAARRVLRFHRLQLRNRHTMERKIVRLLAEFRFAPLGEVIGAVLADASVRHQTAQGPDPDGYPLR